MPQRTQQAVAAADEVEAKADAESQARAEADAAFEEEQRESVREVGTIELTPTWGEIGLLFWRLALSGEEAAIREMRGEFAKAFAGMEVLSKIMSTLTPEQREVFDAVWKVEQAKVLR